VLQAEPINNHVAIYRHDDKIEFYTASGPIYSCQESDLYGLRLAQGIIVTQTATTPAQIAKALNINRTTVYRNLNRYQQDGPAALIIDKSNRGAYRLKGRIKSQ
jgi:DNA invertase Pin-like site-specific DNA recombinase